MNITIYKTFIIISSIFLLQSCSIEKRTLRSGYYIDWDQRSHRSSNNDLISDFNPKMERDHHQAHQLSQMPSEEIETYEIIQEQLDTTYKKNHEVVKIYKSDNLFSNHTIKLPNFQLSEKLDNKYLKLDIIDHKKNDSVETEKKLNNWSLISFIFGCLTFLLGALSLAQLPELLVVAFIFSIFASIAGNISWKQQKSTDNYNRTSKVFSILGMILSFTPLLFGLVLLIISIGNFFSFIKIF
jgi:hypothetical protein